MISQQARLPANKTPNDAWEISPAPGSTPESAARHREYARKIRENYVLDRPRRTSQSGWPKRNTAEHFDRHVWPFQLSNILEDGEEQDIDLRLNC